MGEVNTDDGSKECQSISRNRNERYRTPRLPKGSPPPAKMCQKLLLPMPSSIWPIFWPVLWVEVKRLWFEVV
jgi:hypothetical protein